MLNVDNMNIGELEEFIASAEADPKAVAQSHFPEEKGSVRAINFLVKYAKERVVVLDSTSKGRDGKARIHEEKANNIYRSLPDYAKWLEEND